MVQTPAGTPSDRNLILHGERAERRGNARWCSSHLWSAASEGPELLREVCQFRRQALGLNAAMVIGRWLVVRVGGGRSRNVCAAR